MKKNILAIVILAATLVNITLSVILLFVIVPKAQRTDALIQKIVSLIDLELENPDASDYADVPFEDRAPYALSETLTVNLRKPEGDTKRHYAMVSVTLILNSKAKDYKNISAKLAEHEEIIKSMVIDEVSKYTPDELAVSKEQVVKNVLASLRTYFESTDVFVNVSLNITYE
ncbi:MAG: flagellar basal body-associated FliL family protein [Lachnospiraceae bacterium]